MKYFFLNFITLLIFFYPLVSLASEQNLVGKYEAIEKNRVHVFYPSGDYHGARWHFNKWQEFRGVYEFENNVCQLENLNTGEIVKYGNLLLHVNNSVCCFKVKLISNKISLNNLYERPIHYPDGICANAVLQKAEQ